jgi:hypothetical protein
MLRDRGWFVRNTHGNAFQKGFPDLFAFNESFLKTEFGAVRWIDVKVEGQYRFTKAQCLEWPEWEAGGVGIWIITGDADSDYAKLFDPPNFRDYWKPSYDKYRVPLDDILGDL